ncbi:MAG: rhamnulose-1-phosphate aldolase [Treponema sp.]|jgi:rhamnulose-1-phosphate aldolase|nr:rhamnulose-1-phosphate aldolase [Treponema sp.]
MNDTAPVMRELIKTCSNMYRLGWNERNGGNISLIIDQEEAARYLDTTVSLGNFNFQFDASELAGRIFAVTRTGSYFKNVETDPEHNLGIIKINPDGKSASLLWGFSGGGRPTSELSSHLCSHIVRLRQDKNHRVVTHCHAANTLAMTFIHSLDDRSFTRTLWRMITECIVVFPEGVGVLPWMLCGNDEIGQATAEKMKEYRICIWAQHGIFAAGASLDEAFGLIETVEKAAEIYIKIMNSKILQSITDSELKAVAETFGLDYRKDFLD